MGQVMMKAQGPDGPIDLAADEDGGLLAAGAMSLFVNRGANATLNVKPSAGRVFSLSCRNGSGATAYLQIHNTATFPAGGAAVGSAGLEFVVGAGGQIVIEGFFGPKGIAFATGIAFAFSTTPRVYTAGSATDQDTQITFT